MNIIKFIKKRKNKDAYELEELRRRGVEIGENSCVINSFIDYSHGFLVKIGNNTTLTNTSILAHDASTNRHLGVTKVAPVVIGDNCFIGYGSIILPGTTIGDDVIVGAGAVVRGKVESNSVVIGNPMQVICSTDEYIAANKRRMENSPIYDKTFRNMSEDEKIAIKKTLKNGIVGYEP